MQLIFFTPSNKFESSHRHQICIYVIVMPFHSCFCVSIFRGECCRKLSAGGDCLVLPMDIRFVRKRKKNNSEEGKTWWFFVPNLQWPHSLFALIVVTCQKYCLTLILFHLYPFSIDSLWSQANISIVILFMPNEFHELWYFSGIFRIEPTKKLRPNNRKQYVSEHILNNIGTTTITQTHTPKSTATTKLVHKVRRQTVCSSATVA